MLLCSLVCTQSPSFVCQLPVFLLLAVQKTLLLESLPDLCSSMEIFQFFYLSQFFALKNKEKKMHEFLSERRNFSMIFLNAQAMKNLINQSLLMSQKPAALILHSPLAAAFLVCRQAQPFELLGQLMDDGALFIQLK